MKIATWNVNSIKARLPRVCEWLELAQPDVVLQQELKCQAAAFPYEAIEDMLRDMKVSVTPVSVGKVWIILWFYCVL